jgi:ornithine carbamoyltransferase
MRMPTFKNLPRKETYRARADSSGVQLYLISCFAVINALSDKYHPLQTLADMMTLQEHFGNLSGRTLTWVGDGNNVLHDLMIGAILCGRYTTQRRIVCQRDFIFVLWLGMNVRVATPSGYEADPTVIATARKLAEVQTTPIFSFR